MTTTNKSVNMTTVNGVVPFIFDKEILLAYLSFSISKIENTRSVSPSQKKKKKSLVKLYNQYILKAGQADRQNIPNLVYKNENDFYVVYFWNQFDQASLPDMTAFLKSHLDPKNQFIASNQDKLKNLFTESDLNLYKKLELFLSANVINTEAVTAFFNELSTIEQKKLLEIIDTVNKTVNEELYLQAIMNQQELHRSLSPNIDVDSVISSEVSLSDIDSAVSVEAVESISPKSHLSVDEGEKFQSSQEEPKIGLSRLEQFKQNNKIALNIDTPPIVLSTTFNSARSPVAEHTVQTATVKESHSAMPVMQNDEARQNAYYHPLLNKKIEATYNVLINLRKQIEKYQQLDNRLTQKFKGPLRQKIEKFNAIYNDWQLHCSQGINLYEEKFRNSNYFFTSERLTFLNSEIGYLQKDFMAVKKQMDKTRATAFFKKVVVEEAKYDNHEMAALLKQHLSPLAIDYHLQELKKVLTSQAEEIAVECFIQTAPINYRKNLIDEIKNLYFLYDQAKDPSLIANTDFFKLSSLLLQHDDYQHDERKGVQSKKQLKLQEKIIATFVKLGPAFAKVKHPPMPYLNLNEKCKHLMQAFSKELTEELKDKLRRTTLRYTALPESLRNRLGEKIATFSLPVDNNPQFKQSRIYTEKFFDASLPNKHKQSHLPLWKQFINWLTRSSIFKVKKTFVHKDDLINVAASDMMKKIAENKLSNSELFALGRVIAEHPKMKMGASEKFKVMFAPDPVVAAVDPDFDMRR